MRCAESLQGSYQNDHAVWQKCVNASHALWPFLSTQALVFQRSSRLEAGNLELHHLGEFISLGVLLACDTSP